MKKELPAFVSILYYLLLAITLTGTVLAYYMPVEISIAASGQVSFLGDPQSLSVLEDGIIEKVFLKTASKVEKGQAVLTYHSGVDEKDSAKMEEREISLQNLDSGIIMWERDFFSGDIIRKGERLAVVYPAAPIGLKIQLKDQEMGRVRRGMPVRIALDAYPYQNYGLIYGKVQDIFIQNDPGSGREMEMAVLVDLGEISNDAVKLYPGLRASAEIITGKTSLLKKILF